MSSISMIILSWQPFTPLIDMCGVTRSHRLEILYRRASPESRLIILFLLRLYRLVAGGWRLEAGGWWLVAGNGGRWLAAGGWRLVAGGWCVVAGGWWMVDGGW